MKITYITTDGWWDTDVTIIKDLSEHNELIVHIVKPEESTKYSAQFISANVHIKEHTTEYSGKDFHRIAESVAFCKEIYKDIHNCEILIYTLGNDLILRLFALLFLDVKKTIICTHNYVPHTDSRKKSIESFLTALYYKHFKHFLFYSELQKNLFTKDHPEKHSYFVNMPLKDFGPISENKKEKPVFLFFGYVREYKRLDLFIKAANKVHADALFYIAGKCEDWSRYEKLIENPEKFRLEIKFIANEDIPRIFSEASFLVLPYEDSTQSGPSLIALNYGVPIIASSLPAFAALINNGENGFLFDAGSEDSLTNVLTKAASLSDEEYKSMLERQKEFREQYRETTHIESVIKLEKSR